MCNFQEKPTCLIEHILCYLRGTWNQTIHYSCDSHENPNVLWGWVDADWAGDADTCRSHTGYILMMNGGPISWKSRRKNNVSLFTSEDEFVAASQAWQEAIHLRETLTDFRFSQNKASFFYEDNLACVAMSENPVRREFSRHIDIRNYETWGAGVETQQNKKIFVPLSKKDQNQKSHERWT